MMEQEIEMAATVPRYWGLWTSWASLNGRTGAFIRNTDGRIIYYPNPHIAAAHAALLNDADAARPYIVREFAPA